MCRSVIKVVASFCGGMYLYLTQEKIRQRKTKESERERRSERNDEWRARDRAREIKKVDNNAVGAPSIPWYQAQQAAIIIVLPLHLGQREANVPRKAEYARAFDEQTESGRKKKGFARETRDERIRQRRQR